MDKYEEDAFHSLMIGSQRRIKRIIATSFNGEPYKVIAYYTDGGHLWSRPLEDFRGARIAIGKEVRPWLPSAPIIQLKKE